MTRGFDGRYIGKSLQQWLDEAAQGKSSTECWEILPLPSGQRRLFHDYDENKETPIYVLAYKLHYGNIPENTEISHLCHNPHCCNPTHLVAETHSENMRRSMQGSTHPAAKISEDVALQLRKYYAENNVSIMDTSRHFNLPYMLVYRVIKCVSWKHV